MTELVQQLLAGNRRALARLLTHVENEREGVSAAMAALFPHTGKAWVIGVTGAPGTGKSTLVNALAKNYRQQGKTVGILAVDPTSPFSGGAILGDRIRMRDLSGDSGIFIRSMATRGQLGGLARATLDAIRVMDAAGLAVILVETVGAGQSEVDIARAAQTTLVVEAPGMGDDVQAIKAGILEIADILVVNKADRPGVDHTLRGLKAMLELGHPGLRTQFQAHHGRLLPDPSPPDTEDHQTLWIPPIIQTVASDGKGLDQLVEAIERHRQHLTDDQVMVRLERQRLEIELYSRLQTAMMERLLQTVSAETLADTITRIQSRQLTPHDAVQQLLDTASI